MLCQYGCGNEAKYEFRNGKLCCSKSSNTCPEVKRKNGASVSKALKGKSLDKTDIRLTNVSCIFCKREINYCSIKLHQRSCNKNPENIKILEKNIPCEKCNALHDGTFGSGRFCSQSCASSRIHSKETKEKVRKSLYKFHNSSKIYVRTCKDKKCKKKFVRGWKHRNQKYCSRDCMRNSNWETNLSKAQEVQRKQIENGTFKGWQSRNILSYPEKFWIKVLKNNDLFEKCETNFPIKKRELGIDCSANYFLDFYFPDKKLDLEIDGKQHEYEDRKESDKIRDEYLTNNGITVYRIKWKSINTTSGKNYMKEEIQKFLKYYSSLK